MGRTVEQYLPLCPHSLPPEAEFKGLGTREAAFIPTGSGGSAVFENTAVPSAVKQGFNKKQSGRRHQLRSLYYLPTSIKNVTLFQNLGRFIFVSGPCLRALPPFLILGYQSLVPELCISPQMRACPPQRALGMVGAPQNSLKGLPEVRSFLALLFLLSSCTLLLLLSSLPLSPVAGITGMDPASPFIWCWRLNPRIHAC